MLTVGYASRRSSMQEVGVWRARGLRYLLRGYLDDRLQTTRYFRNLERSEMAAMSFLLGQALTYWFAQAHMGLFYVVHVRGSREQWTAAARQSAMKPGAGPLKPRARPDFIGRGPGQYHVFESKGRSSRVSNAVVRTALSQASMITAVNGHAPATRVAACFAFLASGIRGRVTDPAAEPEALALEYDDVTAAEKTFAFFLQPEFRDAASQLVGGFLCVNLDDDLVYGVDVEVIEKLDDLRTRRGARTVEPLMEFLEGRRAFYAARRDQENSVGNDGIILRGKSTLSSRPRIRRRAS